MKIAPNQFNALLTKPPTNFSAFLFHGNDTGLISERAKQLAHLFNQNLDDVFSVTRLSGEMLAEEDGLIVDSAAAIPALGDRRLVLIKGRGTELLAACKLALSKPFEEAVIIVEAHETTAKHALVKLFENNKKTASIGCYADSISDIRALASNIFATDNIKISGDALEIIAHRLGGDRGSSRREIEKLALMAGPNGKLDTEEVNFALGDNAKLAIDDIADALAGGAVEKLQQSLQKAWHEDTNAVMIVRGCQNYFQQLGLAGYAMQSGKSAKSAIRTLRPPPHFKVQICLQSHLRRWQPQKAIDVVNRLQDVELHIKSNLLDDQIYISQSLLGICLRAPR